MLVIQGGPGESGRKRPLRWPQPPWACSRKHANPSYATRCLTTGCNERRSG